MEDRDVRNRETASREKEREIGGLSEHTEKRDRERYIGSVRTVVKSERERAKELKILRLSARRDHG